MISETSQAGPAPLRPPSNIARPASALATMVAIGWLLGAGQHLHAQAQNLTGDASRSQVVLVQVAPPGGAAFIGLEPFPATPGRVLQTHDILETGDRVWATLLVGPDTVVFLAPNSRLGVSPPGETLPIQGKQTVVLTLYRGQVRCMGADDLEDPGHLRLFAGHGVVALRGSDFIVRVTRDGSIGVGVVDGPLIFQRPIDSGRRFRVDPGHFLSVNATATWIRSETRARSRMEAGTLPPLTAQGFGADFPTPLAGKDEIRTFESEFLRQAWQGASPLDPSLATARGPWPATLE